MVKEMKESVFKEKGKYEHNDSPNKEYKKRERERNYKKRTKQKFWSSINVVENSLKAQ